MKIVKLNSFVGTLRWTIRSWRAGYPISSDFDSWTRKPDFLDLEGNFQELLASNAKWTFLSPFFASKGYFLYLPDEKTGYACPPEIPPPQCRMKNAYPYGRCVYKSEQENKILMFKLFSKYGDKYFQFGDRKLNDRLKVMFHRMLNYANANQGTFEFFFKDGKDYSDVMNLYLIQFGI